MAKFRLIAGIRIGNEKHSREFYRLKVDGYAFSVGHRNYRVVAECECGNRKIVGIDDLRGGHTKSCGCFSRDATVAALTKHGHSKSSGNSSEYRSWGHMRWRCYNPNYDRYDRYGGRGIKVCERFNEFVNFLADMGPKPTPKHSIDRIDNNGHYSCGKCEECLKNSWPANCKWATKKEQMNNMKTNITLTFYGKTMNVVEWSKISQVPDKAIYSRLDAGWPSKEAVWTPTNKKMVAARKAYFDKKKAEKENANGQNMDVDS